MRPWVLLCLVSLVGCKSVEDLACENSVAINEQVTAEQGARDGKTTRQHQRDCIDSLVRLRQQIQPDEDTWFRYMNCLRAATSMAEQGECLAPLTALQNQDIKKRRPSPHRTDGVPAWEREPARRGRSPI